jgi:hypothetical protein
MNKILIILSMLSCVFANAQDTLSKWTLGAVGGLNRSYIQIKSSGEPNTAEIWNSFEEPSWGGYVGVRVSYFIQPKMELISGLNFADRGYRIDTLQEAGLHNIKFQYRFLEIPVALNYGFNLNNKNQVITSLGIAARMLVSDKMLYEKFNQTAVYEMSDIQAENTINTNVTASLGLRRLITETFNLDVYIQGNRALSPLGDGPVSRYLNSLGMFVAISGKL